jgi:hypothetical protein
MKIAYLIVVAALFGSVAAAQVKPAPKPVKSKLISEMFSKSAFLALKTIQRHYSIQPSDEVLKAIDAADAEAQTPDEEGIVSALKGVEAGHFLRNLRRNSDEALGGEPAFEDEDEMRCFAAFEVALKARSASVPKACDLLRIK